MDNEQRIMELRSQIASLNESLIKAHKFLELDYRVYKTLSTKQDQGEYYEGAIGVIENIFDTLKRNGIFTPEN